LVPLLFLRPKLANHSGPRRKIVGLTATVSTLVTAAKINQKEHFGTEQKHR
jgi:hypothetical protein